MTCGDADAPPTRIEDAPGTSRIKVPFPTTLFSLQEWDDERFGEVVAQISPDRLHRALVLSHPPDGAVVIANARPVAMMELRILRIEGGAASATKAPAPVFGFNQGRAGNAWLTTPSKHESRLAAFLAFNA